VSKGRTISRRQFGAGAAAAAFSVLPTTSSLAQTGAVPAASANPWAQLGAIAARARQLGLGVPRLSLGLTGGTAYNEVMPAVVDFIDHLKASAASSNAAKSDVDALVKQASELLMTINNAERAPRSEGEPGEFGVQLTPYTFEALRDQYVSLFNSCVISDAHRAQVAWYVGKLTDSDYDESYDTVEDAICVPWYFVGILHAMEASFNFDAHLHNGDPLDKKTVHVPAGRPPVWLPPSDWPSSAEDALTLEGFANQTDWSLARTLYRMEAYNGFGSRRKGINTPYLWAFSNHYTKGKYVADGKWDPNYVSTQCGGAVMLKALLASGKMTLPS
jgi:lysozyme family protein